MRKYCMLRCAHCTAGSQRAFMFSWRDRLAPNSAGTYGAGNETVGTRYHATSHVRARWWAWVRERSSVTLWLTVTVRVSVSIYCTYNYIQQVMMNRERSRPTNAEDFEELLQQLTRSSSTTGAPQEVRNLVQQIIAHPMEQLTVRPVQGTVV